MALLSLLAVTSMLAGRLPDSIVATGVSIGGLIFLCALALHFLRAPPAWSQRFGFALLKRLPAVAADWIRCQILESRTGLLAMTDGRIVPGIALASGLQWSLIVLAIWLSSVSLGESASLLAITTTLIILVVGLILPNLPMHLGTTQLAFVLGLGLDGTSATTAIAASLI